MSGSRVLVGLAAGCRLPRPGPAPGPCCGHELRFAAPVIAAVTSEPFRSLPTTASHHHHRPIHTTRHLPRSFHLAPPHPPTSHPTPSPSKPSLTPQLSPQQRQPPPPSTASTTLPEQFRTLMRLVTHSVVALTSTHPGPPSRPRAMTASSFTSLSLRPTPVISFNVATPSRTLDAIAASRRFNIHILADDGRGAALADWLARGNHNADAADVLGHKLREEAGCVLLSKPNNGHDDGVEAPMISGPAVRYVLRCKILEDGEDGPRGGMVAVRDHVVVFGEVEEIVSGREKGHASEGWRGEDTFGLLYADRRYRQLGRCIVPKAVKQ